MIRKNIKTCDCFLDICLTISIENTNRYILGQKYVFHSFIHFFHSILLDLKKIKIRVCCFSCVNYMVCLINNGSIENRISIGCNRTDLRDNYAI